jgi:signal transduction histidine kinase
MSRTPRVKINLTQQRCEIGDLIDRAVETVEPAIQARRHRLSVNIVDRAHAVYGDPLRLTQAIANILGNAAKYTECGGQIDVRCNRRNRDIEICVRDKGIGIATEELPRILDLFTHWTTAWHHAADWALVWRWCVA